MSYAYSAGLQAAVYQRLAGDPVVASLVGGAIHDAPLEQSPQEAPGDYITLGEERARANDTKTSYGSVHDFEVVVHSCKDGFDTVKRIAGSVCDALVDAPLALDRGLLVGLRFLSARAERGPAPIKRKISLRFRATIDGGN